MKLSANFELSELVKSQTAERKGISNNPSPDQMKAFSDYFHNLGPVLPCEFCQQHTQQFITENPPALNDRLSLLSWLVKLHNTSNPRNHVTRNQLIYRYTPPMSMRGML